MNHTNEAAFFQELLSAPNRPRLIKVNRIGSGAIVWQIAWKDDEAWKSCVMGDRQVFHRCYLSGKGLTVFQRWVEDQITEEVYLEEIRRHCGYVTPEFSLVS